MALQDAVVAGTVVFALQELSLKDSRIADGLCAYLEQARDPTSTGTAIDILQDFADPRLAPIALRILDSEVNNLLRFQAAFALTAISESAADELMTRLESRNSDVRAAAAAAIRGTKDRRTIEPLRIALKDPDPNVRLQAATSLRFFGEDIQISEELQAEATRKLKAELRDAGAIIPDDSSD